MNIGLTGGIATGKSTVARMLQQRGAILIDADQVAREVVLPGQPALQEITAYFGNEVLHEDGSLNRKKLGSIVFGDESARRALEGMLHPRIRQLMLERKLQYEQQSPERLVVLDIPLLYESGLQHLVDQIMVVYISPECQLERLLLRDKLTEEEAKQRIAAQMSIEEKKGLADYVIHNECSLAETEAQVDAFWCGKGLK